ncbi:Hypothetical protein FKW44_013565 [Caligus rogercresseyi]|uniref:Uncharacterized protein n=1 Tax=Caligus rogercresseyi TaxID=217165 RepID=A0A7T8GXR3_CALRO|nr:Hypothetical protein FKW44_013565 [Caligus rogercresseyi]
MKYILSTVQGIQYTTSVNGVPLPQGFIACEKKPGDPRLYYHNTPGPMEELFDYKWTSHLCGL